MALSAWKATAQQSISNSAIQSSVKGMQKKKKGGEGGGKDIKKRRAIFVRAAKANIPPASTRPLFPLLKVKLVWFFFPSSVIFLGAFQKLYQEVSY